MGFWERPALTESPRPEKTAQLPPRRTLGFLSRTLASDIRRLDGNFGTAALKANESNASGSDATGHVRRMNDALAAANAKRADLRWIFERMNRVELAGSQVSPEK